MRLLINLAAHDGIISYYTGVGTMVKRYITILPKILKEMKIDFDINLFTPQYNKDSFGYDQNTYEEHNQKNIKIFQISNGSDGKVNFGSVENWEELSRNTAKEINLLDITSYDKVLNIFNDIPYAQAPIYIENHDKNINIWIPHSTTKLYKVDSAIKNSQKNYTKNVLWEESAVKYINNNEKSFVGAICNFMKTHLISKYGLNEDKIIEITNGIIPTNDKLTNEYCSSNQFEEIKNLESIILSYGRAENYKNLQFSMLLSEKMKIPAVVIVQTYFDGQPIIKTYKNIAKKTNSYLYIDPPFSLPRNILTNFNGKIILIIPSKREAMGLIVNEARKINRDNILIVANNIDGLKEQITDGQDGLLIDVKDIEKSALKIEKYLNSKDMKRMNENSQQRLKKDFNLETNLINFIKECLEV